MIESSMMINDKMPAYCIERADRFLGVRSQRSIYGSKVLILGVAYKQDIDDFRESPAIDVIDLLKKVRGRKFSSTIRLSPVLNIMEGCIKGWKN